MGGFSKDSGLNRGRIGFGQGISEGQSICSWELHGKFDVWIYGIELLLKLVDLIFPGCTMDVMNIPRPPFDQCQ